VSAPGDSRSRRPGSHRAWLQDHAPRGRERAGGDSAARDRRPAGQNRNRTSHSRRGVREAGGRMKKILLVAGREFVATVSTKAFLIGLLIMPLMIGVSIIVFPRLLNPRNFKTQGEIAVVDPSGRAIEDVRKAFSQERVAQRREDQARLVLNQAPPEVQQVANSRGTPQMAAAIASATAAPDLSLVERPSNADVQKEKSWLLEQSERHHLALVVVHDDAVVSKDGKTFGSYDAYVPANVDDRAMNEIQAGMQEALVNARTRERGLDRAQIESLVRVARAELTTVTKD